MLGPILLPLVGNRQEVISRLDSIGDPGGGAAERMILAAARRYVAVVSHDCEFNEGKRDRILLARISGLDKRVLEDPEQLEALRLSNDVEARHEANEAVDGVDSFVLEPLAGHLPAPEVVVFTTITPYPARMINQLHAEKKAELLHEQRLLFRRKLAWFFLRNPEDVVDELKRSPADVMAQFAPEAPVEVPLDRLYPT